MRLLDWLFGRGEVAGLRRANAELAGALAQERALAATAGAVLEATRERDRAQADARMLFDSVDDAQRQYQRRVTEATARGDELRKELEWYKRVHQNAEAVLAGEDVEPARYSSGGTVRVVDMAMRVRQELAELKAWRKQVAEAAGFKCPYEEIPARLAKINGNVTACHFPNSVVYLEREASGHPPQDDAPEDLRRELWAMVEPAARHALRAATDNGRVVDLDPDALIQNLRLGLFGYEELPALEPRGKWYEDRPAREDAVTLAFDMGDHDVRVRRLRRNLKPGQFALGRAVTCGTPPDAPVQAWRVSAVGQESGEVVVHLENWTARPDLRF